MGAWENVVEITRRGTSARRGEIASRVRAVWNTRRKVQRLSHLSTLIYTMILYVRAERGTIRFDTYRPKPPLSEIEKPRVHVRSSVSCLMPIRIARDSTRSRIPSNESPFLESLLCVRSFPVARNTDRVPLLHIHFVTRVLKIINCRLYSERKTPVS
jgi:hypothetical protein